MREWLGKRQVEAEVQEWAKPSGLDVRDMYRLDMYASGEELPAGDSPLKVEVAVREHVLWCEECGKAGRLSDACYFYSMSRCISHG